LSCHAAAHPTLSASLSIAKIDGPDLNVDVLNAAGEVLVIGVT